MQSSADWSHETDVLIVGSGAGALTAAVRAHDLGSKVLVLEKTAQFGGSSAMSGGVLWLPNSPLIAGAGGEDCADAGKRYLKSVVADAHLDRRIESYVDNIPGFVDFLHRHTHLRLAVLPHFPDMYPDNPDFRMHRCHEAVPFHARVLPVDELLNLRPQHPQTTLFGLIGWTPSESLTLQARGKGWVRVALSMVGRYIFDIPWRFRSRRDRRLVLGGALIGALRHSMMDRGMPLWLNTPVVELIKDDDGRIVGVTANRAGVRTRIRARKAVVLASGGFEKSKEMRQRHLAQPTDTAWSAGSPGNTGEIIEMGEKIGAGLECMGEAWWGPTITIPGEPQARMLVIEKNLPGAILVNRRGQRFVNESSSYTKVIRGIFAANSAAAETIPSYMIFDSTYRRHYPIGPMLPSNVQPDALVPAAVRQAIPSAPDLDTLARQLGIDPAGLADTVHRFNEFARTGKDLDFQRGDAAYDRYYGDQRIQPNPCLGPIKDPPFYGVRVFPGELGTKGGLSVDEFARVLDISGGVIDGLYAIGNCGSPVTGATYPASGATLGPAMVFGYVVANHIGSMS